MLHQFGLTYPTAAALCTQRTSVSSGTWMAKSCVLCVLSVVTCVLLLAGRSNTAIISAHRRVHINCTVDRPRDAPSSIPLVIYRGWRDDALPREFEQAWNVTRRSNPHVRQVLFTNDDMDEFISRQGHPVASAFNKLFREYGAARADLFRYAILYERGGIWLDIKSYAITDMSSITRQQGIVVSKWSHRTGQPASFCRRGFLFSCVRGEYQQWWMAASPRHPALKRVIDRVVSNINKYSRRDYPPGKQSVLRLTGPTTYTISIDEAISSGIPGIRIVCPDGNGAFVYRNESESHIASYSQAEMRHYSVLTSDIVVPDFSTHTHPL